MVYFKMGKLWNCFLALFGCLFKKETKEGSFMGVTAKERLCKQPAESRKYGVEFNSLLASSETISSITSITSEKIDGTTTDLTIDTSTIESSPTSSKNSLVTFWIAGGTTGQTYKVETLVVSSDGAILEGDTILFVSDR